MKAMKTVVCAAAMCVFASSALAWEPGLAGGKLSYAPSSTEAKTLLPETTQVYLSPHVASLWNTGDIYKNNIMWVYAGLIYLDGSYAFGAYFDDSVQLTLDGELLFGCYNNWTTYRTATVTKPAGWYPIEIRLGNTSGGAGADGVYVTNPDTQQTELCGFGYKKLAEGELPPTSNAKNSMKFYQKLLDDGSGSLLRCGANALQMDASVALDAANGKIVVSALVRMTNTAEAMLEAIVKRSDGVTTTNTIATAVVASETPYTYDVTDLVGGLAYEIVVRLSDSTGLFTEFKSGIYVGEVGVEAVSDADVTKDQLGSFRIFRGTTEAALAYDLVVNYTIGGTAVMGRDYVEIPTAVTIPAGESEVFVSIDALCNMAMPDEMTVSLTLGAGGYVPDPAASAATIGIVKPDLHHDWVYDPTARTLSDGLWTFNATVSSGALTVGTLRKTCFKSGPLDLSKPVEGGETITVIGLNALLNCKVITDLFLPETITQFDTSALSGCSNLKHIEPFLPAAVTRLGRSAFMDCTSLEGDLVLGTNGVEVTLDGGSPNGMQFRATKISTLTLGEGVTVIRDDVFRNCTNLVEVRAHDNMTSIGSYCFAGCSSLTNFTPSLPSKLTNLGGGNWGNTFSGCGNLKIGIVIGSGVSSCAVGNRAFQSAGITSIRFAGSVKTVPDWCFEWCYNLTNAVLEEGVQEVGGGAFQSTALTHVRLPEKSLKTLGGSCFRTTLSGDSRCGRLVSVEPFLPRSITSMGDRVFCLSFAEKVEPSLDELVIRNDDGANIQLVGGWQFEGAPSKKVTLGPGITALSSGMLQSMKSVTELRFECPYPPYTGTPFWGWPTRQTCVYVPAEEKGWMDFLTNTAYVTPWKGTDDVPGVSDTLKTEFATKFPGRPHPFGLSTTSAMFGSQWIYKVNKPGMKLLFR